MSHVYSDPFVLVGKNHFSHLSLLLELPDEGANFIELSMSDFEHIISLDEVADLENSANQLTWSLSPDRRDVLLHFTKDDLFKESGEQSDKFTLCICERLVTELRYYFFSIKEESAA